MIKVGYSSVNESISGPLATALKQMTQKQKNGLINSLRRSNIDFNRSIGQAEKINANDPRLKVDGNTVIGVYTDANDKTCMTAYEIGSGPIVDTTASISMVKDNSGKVVNLPNFANVSWKKWISIMSAFYIIEKDKATSVKELRDQRLANHDTSSDNVSKALTDKVKEIANRYGYSISVRNEKWDDKIIWTNVNIRNNDRHSLVDVRYDQKDGFGISTTGTWLTETEALKMSDDIKKAIELIHKLNQVNFNKVGRIRED